MKMAFDYDEREIMKRYIPFVLLVFLVKANSATIFECEALSSGRFYSTGECSTHRAVIVTRHKVPDGLPFEQQVDLINKTKTSKAAMQSSTNQTFERNNQCAGIDSELNRLQGKYTNWQYVPIDEVNSDQQKERDLKTRRSQLGCASR